MALPKVERKMSRTEEDGGGAEHKPFFSTKVILPNLEKLVLSSLGSFTSIWKSFPSDDSFCKLVSIEIEKCNSLQILVLPEQRQQDLKETASFKLQLENAEIMNNSSGKQELGFPFLTNIKIDECAQLKSLFSDSIARTLFELENLHISSCKKMVEVVFTQNEEMMMFDKLCSLKLEDLDELQCFSTGSAEYYFPCLKELSISRCTKFKAFIMSPNSSTDANVNSTPSFLEKVIIPELEKLHIEQLELEEIFSSMLFCQVKDLEVEACHQLLTVIPSFIFPYMQSLESLTVKNCNSVRAIFEFGDSTFVDRKFTSSKSWKLKTIRLHGLPQLEHICQNENFLEFFPFNDLEILAVESCKLLRSIFKLSTTKILAKLQELSIAFCESIEHVVEHGQDCSIGGTNKIILHQLAVLKFSYLPKLSSFCSTHMTEWPSLVDVELDNCDIVEAFAANSGQHLKPLFLLEKVAFPKMESLKISWLKNMKELWNIGDERTECSFKALSKLRVLEILYCNGLSTIFPSKMVRGLGELEKLKVGDCDSVEQVFQVQGFRKETEFKDNDGSITIDFSLRELVLEQLPALNHVWNIVNSEGLNLTCEKLQRVSINYCGNLKYMLPASIARSLDQLVAVKIRGCTGMEEIVQREVYGTDDNNNGERYQSIPNLKVIYLKLANLPELTSIPCKDCLAFKLINCPKAKVHAPSLEEKSGGCDIINSTEKMNGKVNIFSNLKQLATDTEGLHEMRFLDVFANLPYLFLKTIDEAAAKRFPWKFLLENFHNLEFLRIDDCYFEDLFTLEDEKAQEENKEITSHNSKQERPHLQSLRRLELHDLPNLKQVLKKDSAMEGILDIISDLLVWNCPSLKHLFQAAASFRNLAFVDVYRCGEMVYLLTSSAARCLEQLTVLDVSHCNIMKEIVIEDQDGNGGADDICFPRLKEIRLAGLNELRSFCSSESCKFRFPSLESVSMENLPELKAFCQGGFEAPLLHDIATEGEEKEASRLKGVVEQEG